MSEPGSAVHPAPRSMNLGKIITSASRNIWAIALGLPGLLFFCLLFIFPTARMMLRSASGDLVALYSDILLSGIYVAVFFRSSLIALETTVITLIIAYPLAFFITRLNGWQKMLSFFLVLLPFWSSQLVRTYAWTALLGRQGVINGALLWAGVIDEPLRLSNGTFAVLIGSVHVMLPFMVLPLYAVMSRIDHDVLRAAALCGGNHWYIFRRVHLPLCRNGIATGCILVFILTLGSFVIPSVLGGGRVMMISLLIDQQARLLGDWSRASALATLFLVAVVILVSVFTWLANFRNPLSERGGTK